MRERIHGVKREGNIIYNILTVQKWKCESTKQSKYNKTEMVYNKKKKAFVTHIMDNFYFLYSFLSQPATTWGCKRAQSKGLFMYSKK